MTLRKIAAVFLIVLLVLLAVLGTARVISWSSFWFLTLLIGFIAYYFIPSE